MPIKYRGRTELLFSPSHLEKASSHLSGVVSSSEMSSSLSFVAKGAELSLGWASHLMTKQKTSFVFTLNLTCFAFWLAKKSYTTFSTNENQNWKQSSLVQRRFPATCFPWDLIGSFHRLRVLLQWNSGSWPCIFKITTVARSEMGQQTYYSAVNDFYHTKPLFTNGCLSFLRIRSGLAGRRTGRLTLPLPY